MKTNQRKLFLEELRKIGIIQVACEKSGISRNTVYRWRKTSESFAKDMEEALAEGVALVNDMAESTLLNLIRNQEFSAVRFWLQNRHKAYKLKSEVVVEEKISEEEFRKHVELEKARIMRAQRNWRTYDDDSDTEEEERITKAIQKLEEYESGLTTQADVENEEEDEIIPQKPPEKNIYRDGFVEEDDGSW